MSFQTLDPIKLIDRDHMVDGLFVKECRPLDPRQTNIPIIMAHGSSHGWWAWQRWQPFFANAGWSTYAFSFRGHSGSYMPPEADYLNATIFDYVDDLKSIMDWLGRPAVLMGHSLGGIVAQKAAEDAKLAALIPIASIGPSQIGIQRPGAPPPLDRSVMPSPEEAKARWLHDPWPQEKFNQFYASLSPESPGVLAWSGTGRTEVDPAKVTCPVLCVGGADDQSYVPKAEALAGVYGADWFEQPDAGHNMMVEAASIDTAQRINHWLISTLGLDRSPVIQTAAKR